MRATQTVISSHPSAPSAPRLKRDRVHLEVCAARVRARSSEVASHSFASPICATSSTRSSSNRAAIAARRDRRRARARADRRTHSCSRARPGCCSPSCARANATGCCAALSRWLDGRARARHGLGVRRRRHRLQRVRRHHPVRRAPRRARREPRRVPAARRARDARRARSAASHPPDEAPSVAARRARRGSANSQPFLARSSSRRPTARAFGAARARKTIDVETRRARRGPRRASQSDDDGAALRARGRARASTACRAPARRGARASPIAVLARCDDDNGQGSTRMRARAERRWSASSKKRCSATTLSRTARRADAREPGRRGLIDRNSASRATCTRTRSLLRAQTRPPRLRRTRRSRRGTRTGGR